MGMHLNTSINYKARAICKLADTFSRLQISGMSSAKLTEHYVAVIQSLERCPEWVRAYVKGWYDATKSMYERDLVFFYTMPDGSLVSTHRDRDDYYEKLGIGPKEVYDKAVASGHYWVREQYDNGVKKEKLVPYFVSRMEKVGTCSFCKAEHVKLIYRLKADPDQKVCVICHQDARVPTEYIPPEIIE